MPGPKGIEAVAKLARRAKSRRGGNVAVREDFDRQAPDSLALWRDTYLETLGARNYSDQTREGRNNAIRHFLGTRTGWFPWAPGPLTGWSVTWPKSGPGSAWTRARRPCS
jgi:hypothetical protein